MNRWCGKVAAVTGASAGIGAAIARSLVQKGMIVVGLARRKEKMEKELECVKDKGTFIARKLDITDECAIIHTFEWIKKEFGGVNVLVNNAGIAIPGQILDVETAIWKQTIDVNVLGTLRCTREAVKILKETCEEGHIININSVLGHRIPRTGNAFPLNVYPSTKFAITALTQTLEDELRGSRIKISSISPGLVKTEIFDFDKDVSGWPYLESEDIADAVVYALGTHPRVQLSDIMIRPVGEAF
ncbi:farnesol dehydrogenase-like [Belonocnema kinseyi]|uniref:farnesol dehydrogenase-like n=1 Tax=Belonocnema kinseyi TaxID=2817044 RepID=UPI00143CC4FA|nr:farnesol dehydrogenase-like [Belonocnema kinseyi]